jgi:hypothetical protein
MSDAVIDVRVGELHAVARVVDRAMTLTLLGTADAAAEAALNELLGRLHNESQRAGAREVVVDLHGLEFMNSSCFKSFITWIVAVRRLPEDQHYRIRFRSNPALHWQKRSLHAISYFGGELVSVDHG